MKLKIEEIRKKLAQRGEQTFHLQREMQVDTATIDEANCTAEFSVSSEYPVLRWFGYEILDHQTTSIRWGRITTGAAHRDGHFGDQIGIITKAWIDTVEKKLRVLVQFSKNTARAIEIFKDIVDGIRKNVSIAYDIYELVLEKETENMDYYRITDWEPIHTCHTPDGADPTVGSGRSKDNNRSCGHTNTRMESDCCNVELDDDAVDGCLCPDCGEECNPIEVCRDCGEKVRNKNSNKRDKSTIVIKHKRSTNLMTPEEKAEQEKAEKLLREKWEKEAKDLSDAEKKRAIDNAASIFQLVADFTRNLPGIDLMAEGQKYIREEKSFKDFYDFCSGKLHDPEATRTAAAHGSADEHDMKGYSLARAILSMSNPTEFAKLGIEREMHQTIQKSLNREVGNCLLVPTSAFGFRSKRAQVVGTPGLGGNTVFETPIAQTFVEFLHNQLAFIGAGVNVLDGLTGDIPLVREANQHTFTFKAERTAPDSSDVTFAKETYGPKLGGALTTLSRQMLLQSPNVSEAWARRKLLGAVMRGMDRTIAYGAGGLEPIGFKNMTGPHGIVGAGFGRDKAIDMITAIRAVNAEIGSFNFVANPLTKGDLQKKPLAANYPAYLVDDKDVMVGRPFKDANQVDAGDLFYGGWSNLDLLLWGYILVEANPWGSGWAAGDIDVKANIAMNLMAEHPEAISIAEGVN